MYLTFDLGTTSLKTCLVREDGAVQACSVGEYKARMPAPGQMEMPPETYWRAAVEGARAVLARADTGLDEVAAVGLSSQSQTFLPLGKHGQPLYDVLVWLDKRGSEVAARWQADWLTTEHFREVSGYPSIPVEMSVFKIAWLRENVPSVRSAWKFLWLPDYLIYRLSGETVTDPVTARMGGLFSLKEGAWDPALMSAAGLSPDQLPEVRPCGSIAGKLSASAAEELGLRAGTPVCTGANDQLVGAIGAGNVSPGLVTETTGTALAVIASTPRLLRQAGVMVGAHAVPGLYYAMSYANTAAVLLTWLRDLCGETAGDYHSFLAGAESIPPGCDGLTVLPHFMGASPPMGSTAARGAFLGLTLSHSRLHLVRAVMEACACLLKDCLGLLGDIQPAALRSLGSSAQSDLWLQIKADLLGLAVERPACGQANAVGAAMLAAVATGQFARLEDAAAAWYRPAAVFLPQVERFAVYQDLYARYRQYGDLIYPALAPTDP